MAEEKTNAKRGNVTYVSSAELLKECDRIPVIKERASMVHCLIMAYNLDLQMDVVQPKVATDDDLALFHSQYYLNYLRDECGPNASDSDGDSEASGDVDDEQMQYGLGYDCPKLRNLRKFAAVIAGGTITAADLLLAGRQTVINWCGGWHHGQRDEAEGFCYINDIAIGIQRLRARFQRVLYIDIDIHHGNGVENAFAYTKRIFTLSFHQYCPGFFPGSGGVDDCGVGAGSGYCVNFPYKVNISGELFVKYFLMVTEVVKSKYQPDVCVVQCGADALTGDPLGGTNLVPEDIGRCIKHILGWQLPTMFLGGGGYNLANTARYWTYLTSVVCGSDHALDDEIPDNAYFLEYGPGYELSIGRRNAKDLNCDEYLADIFRTIKLNLEKHNVHNC